MDIEQLINSIDLDKTEPPTIPANFTKAWCDFGGHVFLDDEDAPDHKNYARMLLRPLHRELGRLKFDYKTRRALMELFARMVK